MEDEVFEEVYKFSSFKDWQHQVIDAGIKFFEKYKVQPQFIRIKDSTMDILLEEAERNYFNPLDSEHSVMNSDGEEIVPIRRDVTDPDSKFAPAEGFTVGRDAAEDDDDFPIHVYPLNDEDDNDEMDYDDDEHDFDTDPDSPVTLRSFGFTEDGRISFTTSKYRIFFLEGEDLDEDSFALNYGEDPDSEDEDD
jgi:hypothetical protein